MIKNQFIALLSAGFLFAFCSHHAATTTSSPAPKMGMSGVSSPPCIVYKTRKDYSMYVPVMLSPDKSKVESYPDIKDIYYNGKFAVPTLLVDGYLLDNRGIGPQVAFMWYTYEEYSKLPSTPPAANIMGVLQDKDPLTEMYQCGRRSDYKDIEQELNDLIRSGKLNTFKKLK